MLSQFPFLQELRNVIEKANDEIVQGEINNKKTFSSVYQILMGSFIVTIGIFILKNITTDSIF